MTKSARREYHKECNWRARQIINKEVQYEVRKYDGYPDLPCAEYV